MTERKRATHYCLMDSAFAADRKFVRLARKATIPIEFAAAVGVYWLILADARRSKSPEIDWLDYEEYGPQVELLQSVGLLTDSGFPPDPFSKWAPAYKSPYDATRGTKGNTRVRNGTQGDTASVQFNSPREVGGPGEGGTFMGWQPKAAADAIQAQEERDWSKCSECGVIGRKHPAGGDHPFTPEKLRAVK